MTVLGGGATGTTLVAMLVNEGHDVTWIDEKHGDIGRIGRYYSGGVPANTLNQVLLKGLQGVDAFNYNLFVQRSHEANVATLSDLPGDSCSDLKYLHQPLQFASSSLLRHPKVNAIEGRLISADFSHTSSVPWSFVVCLNNGCGSYTSRTFRSKVFFMAQGSKPSFPSNVPQHYPHQNVDICVSSQGVGALLKRKAEWRRAPWAVVGSSHSAMLVVKNLVDAGVKNVVNFYRSEFIFETQAEDGSYRNRGSGLKGDVGNWVRNDSASCTALTRIRLTNDKELATAVVPFGEKVVYAVGYERDNTFDLLVDGQAVCPHSLSSYDKSTGEITELSLHYDKTNPQSIPSGHCFGLGIAFPTTYIDGAGRVEEWVGFHRNIEQIRCILPLLNVH